LKDQEQLARIVAQYPEGRRENLIPLLQDVQEAFGYLATEAMQAIGAHLGLPASKVFGVATFYNQFKFEPPGQCHCQVCRGTACHVQGSARVLDAVSAELGIAPGHTTRDGRFSLEVVACMGACGLAPVVSMDGDVHAGVSPNGVRKLVKKYARNLKKEPEHVEA
jgi:NADH-quinone oxidoreductase subunit E